MGESRDCGGGGAGGRGLGRYLLLTMPEVEMKVEGEWACLSPPRSVARIA